MKSHFEYKGYFGSAEVDAEGKALVGKLLFIRDVIAYSALDVNGLKAAFEEAVEDYLETCKELGEEPEIPCKGGFNVRIGPDLHREVALMARAKGVSLNDFVCTALTSSVREKPPVTVEHLHQHQHQHEHVLVVKDTQIRRTTPGKTLAWEQIANVRPH